MVGRGFLRPDLNLLRSDTPKALRRLLEDCIKFARDDRPLFRQVSQPFSLNPFQTILPSEQT